MKRVSLLAFLILASMGLAVSAADKEGGACGAGEKADSTVGGASGGAQGAMPAMTDMERLKKENTKRLAKVDLGLQDIKSIMKDMPAEQQESMKTHYGQTIEKRDMVKKMSAEMKTAEDVTAVESAMNELERSVKTLSSIVGRTSSAGGYSDGAAEKPQSDISDGGGQTGGSAGADISTMRSSMESRLEKIDRGLKQMKQNAKNTETGSTDSINMMMIKLQGDRDTAGKMVKEMKTPRDASMAESALNDLEQSVRRTSSGAQRSSSAGDSGGSTGGASVTTSTSTTESMEQAGGETGGSGQPVVMQYSYDQREMFYDAMKTRLDGFSRRIDVIRDTATNSPEKINAVLRPKTDELYGSSNAIKDDLAKIKNAERAKWDEMKTSLIDKVNTLQEQLMQTEKMIR